MVVTLRQVRPEDQSFLFQVYAESHADDIERLDWDDSEKQAFLRMKFTTQDQFYHRNFPKAEYSVILLDGTLVGRLYVDRSHKAELHLLNIALLPEYRCRGIGSELLQKLINEATDQKARIRINIEQANRARKLYEKLGFYTLHHRGVYDYMEWSPRKARNHSNNVND